MEEFEDYCKTCDTDVRKQYVERKDEFYVYECSMCGTEHEYEEEEVEESIEE